MHIGAKIAIGVIVAGTIGYVAYKLNTTPTLTVTMMNSLDGSGFFTFGKSADMMIPSPVDGGWGYTGSWGSFIANTGWIFQVVKNGTIVKTISVTGPGKY